MRTFNRFHRHLAIDLEAPGRGSTVLAAFVAGALVAVVKTLAATLTGSASMLAEAIHSWVDTLTDAFLVAGYLAARRPADENHTLGYGRESYVWSLFGSVAMFVLGAEVGVWRGITQLSAAEATTDYRFGYIVLAGSFVLQSVSFVQALNYVRKRAVEQDSGVFAHVFSTSDSQLRAVVTEDFIALVGLVVAGLGMALHEFTGKVAYDAAGSILIGTLMGLGGLFLINMNRRFLAGMPLSGERRARAIKLLCDAPEVNRVTFFFAEFIGPDRILVAARVELAGNLGQADLARRLRDLEQRIMAHKNVGRAILTLSAPEEQSVS